MDGIVDSSYQGVGLCCGGPQSACEIRGGPVAPPF